MRWIEFDQSSEYFAHSGLSQSQVKALLAGMGSFKSVDPDAEDPEHFILGNAVDCKLLTPSLFDSQFYISTLDSKPSDKAMSIIRHAYANKGQSMNITDNRAAIQAACNAKAYYMNRAKADPSNDGRVDDIIKKAGMYWGILTIADGRTILDRDELLVANTIVDAMKSHEHTRSYFESRPGVIYMAQLPLYWTYNGVNCKGLLDLLIIDTINKTLQIVDVKTMGEITKLFPKNARKRRYDIQAAWYSHGLSLIKRLSLDTINSIDISDYRILPFKFIVDSTTQPGFCPLVYTCTDVDLKIGRYGASTKSTVFKIHTDAPITPTILIKGFEEGIELFKWHHLNSDAYDKYILETGGDIPLEIWNL